MKVLAFSDLHLFAARSRGEKFLVQIDKQIKAADTCVICGDLFDFRWSNDASLEESVQNGKQWLFDFCARQEGTEIIYILGNHDGIAEFIPHLEEVGTKIKNFSWHSDFVQIGTTLFMHGDIPMKSSGANITPRELNHSEYLRHSCMSVLYSAVTYVGLLKLWRKYSNQNRHIHLLAEAVQTYQERHATNIKDVVFGHSHNALSDFVEAGLTFHNCGTGIWGFRRNPYVSELDVE